MMMKIYRRIQEMKRVKTVEGEEGKRKEEEVEKELQRELKVMK